MKKIIFLLAVCFFCFSCSRTKTIATVSKEALFTLDYGTFENELNLYNLAESGEVNTHIAMRDGFFYIANGEAKKIMELNSYGNLLTLYYNEEYNRKPSFALNSGNGEQENATCRAISYPFNTLGPLAVDSKKNLFVCDTLPNERQEIDTEKNLLLSNVILRFSSEGEFIDYLGQEGPGGTPFSVIKKIYTTKKDELVVVCITNEGLTAFWFNVSGYLLYMIPISNKTVPNPLKKSETTEMYISIENAIPDPKERILYLEVNYFESSLDPALKVQSGVDYRQTLLYPLDVENAVYKTPFEIAAYEEVVSNGLSKQTYYMPYDFFGITENSWFFFSVPIEKGYSIQALSDSGRVLKRNLNCDSDKMLYYSLNLSTTGIVTGLFAGSEDAEVSWWRTDQLVN